MICNSISEDDEVEHVPIVISKMTWFNKYRSTYIYNYTGSNPFCHNWFI